MIKIKKSIGAILLTSTVLFTSTASQAVTTTTVFLDIIVDGGAFNGNTGTGTLKWDNADVSGLTTILNVGVGSFTANSSEFFIDLDIFGQNFTGADAANPSTLSFSNNDPSQLIYTVDSGINQAGIDSFSFVGGLIDSGVFDTNGNKPLKVYVSTVNTSVVPVPASAWLFISGLLGLVGLQRRKR